MAAPCSFEILLGLPARTFKVPPRILRGLLPLPQACQGPTGGGREFIESGTPKKSVSRNHAGQLRA